MSSEKTRKRELDAFAEATEELHCDKLLIITNSEQRDFQLKNLIVNAIPINKF